MQAAPEAARPAAEGAGAREPESDCVSYTAPAELAARDVLTDGLAAALAGIDALVDDVLRPALRLRSPASLRTRPIHDDVTQRAACRDGSPR
jgi:hypothetical protein